LLVSAWASSSRCSARLAWPEDAGNADAWAISAWWSWSARGPDIVFGARIWWSLSGYWWCLSWVASVTDWAAIFVTWSHNWRDNVVGAFGSPFVGVLATVARGHEESSAGARHGNRSPVIFAFPRSALPEEVGVGVSMVPCTVGDDVAVRSSAVLRWYSWRAVGWWTSGADDSVASA
jgi:hypothetical protein